MGDPWCNRTLRKFETIIAMTPKKIYLSKLVMAGAEILDKPVSDDDVEYIRADVIRNEIERLKEDVPCRYHPYSCASVLEAYEELLSFLSTLESEKPMGGLEEFPKWKKIKAGERLPCPAYVWTIAYDNYPDCFEGRLMPNIEGVKVGRDTWYLPVDVIHNLPKED